jgi:hypothetical protein
VRPLPDLAPAATVFLATVVVVLLALFPRLRRMAPAATRSAWAWLFAGTFAIVLFVMRGPVDLSDRTVGAATVVGAAVALGAVLEAAAVASKAASDNLELVNRMTDVLHATERLNAPVLYSPNDPAALQVLRAYASRKARISREPAQYYYALSNIGHGAAYRIAAVPHHDCPGLAVWVETEVLAAGESAVGGFTSDDGGDPDWPTITFVWFDTEEGEPDGKRYERTVAFQPYDAQDSMLNFDFELPVALNYHGSGAWTAPEGAD